MTMIEKGARALFDAMTLDGDAEFDYLPLGERNMLKNYARAVLEAVRVPDDDFMMRLYPDPKTISADGGACAGVRSRRSGRMQIDHFISTILTEGKSK